MVELTQTPFSSAPWQSNYQALGKQFFSAQLPTPVAEPNIVRFNSALAQQLGLADSADQELARLLAGNNIARNSQPIATVYAGHQFGHWNPQLGDGRAILLGELTGADGRLYDVQLKGAGPTPYSRNGDGRSPLGPVLREYVVSEAMAALGIATTRALGAVSTGQRVLRDTPLPGAILARVASSHIRIGSLQFFAARRDTASVKTLADHVISRHYAEYIEQQFADDRYTGLLNAVVEAQALLIAQWMSVGFIHGVMNTDNMLLCGETVDYGPCAFMDNYNPQQVYSSIDRQGRYAYDNQPEIGLWNLSCLAQALLPLLDENQSQAIQKAEHALGRFAQCYSDHYQRLFAAKLGFNQHSADSQTVVDGLLTMMAQQCWDFSHSFRSLISLLDKQPSGLPETVDFSVAGEAFSQWQAQWLAELAAQNISHAQAATKLAHSNPLFIPRNHWLEKAINTATDQQDFTVFHQLVDCLANPFEDQPQYRHLASAPDKAEAVFRTFCGT